MSWITAPVGSFCKLVNGKAFKPTDWSEAGEPIIRIQNLNDAEKPFNYWAGSLERQVLVKPGDVLFAWSGTPGTSFGGHIWDGPSGVLNQHIFRVELDPSKITREWFVAAINFKINLLIDQAHGGVGLQHVTRPMVDKLELPMPPLNEQRRIAAILDQADALCRKQRQALGLHQRLPGALFTELLGVHGQEQACGVVTTLGEVCSVIRDGTHKTPNYVEAGVPFVTVKNITSGELDLTSTKFITAKEHAELTRRVKPQAGDILVTKDGTIGIPCLVRNNTEFSIFVSVALVRPIESKIYPQFLEGQLRSAWLQKQIRDGSKGIAIRHLHLESFRRLQIVLPDMETQRAFCRKLDVTGNFRAVQRRHLARLDALFASLQHRAFAGEL